MYNVIIETTRETSTQRIHANDVDHALRIAHTRQCDRDVTFIAIKRRHKLISIVVDKRFVVDAY